MEDETKSNSQCNNSELQDNINLVLEKVEHLTLFLPPWIGLRDNTIDCFRISPKSDSPHTCSYLRYACSAVANAALKIPALRSELAIAVGSTAASVASFGIFNGYKNASAKIDQRRFSSAVDYLIRDVQESSYLQTILTDLMQAFSTIQKFPMDRLVDEKTGSNIAGKFSNDYDGDFVEWCEKFYVLLNKFLSILLQSMEPYRMIADFSSQNSQNRMNESHILDWVKRLEESLPAVNKLRQHTDEVIKSLNDQVRRRHITKTLKDELKNSDASQRGDPNSDQPTANDDDWCIVDNQCNSQLNNNADRHNLPAMDQWFQMVHSLFVSSVRVAGNIFRLLSDENLPPLLANIYMLEKMKAKKKVITTTTDAQPNPDPDPNPTSGKIVDAGSQ